MYRKTLCSLLAFVCCVSCGDSGVKKQASVHNIYEDDTCIAEYKIPDNFQIEDIGTFELRYGPITFCPRPLAGSKRYIAYSHVSIYEDDTCGKWFDTDYLDFMAVQEQIAASDFWDACGTAVNFETEKQTLLADEYVEKNELEKACFHIEDTENLEASITAMEKTYAIPIDYYEVDGNKVSFWFEPGGSVWGPRSPSLMLRSLRHMGFEVESFSCPNAEPVE